MATLSDRFRGNEYHVSAVLSCTLNDLVESRMKFGTGDLPVRTSQHFGELTGSTDRHM